MLWPQAPNALHSALLSDPLPTAYWLFLALSLHLIFSLPIGMKAHIPGLAWQLPLLSPPSSAQMSPQEATWTAPTTHIPAIPANLLCSLYSINTLLYGTSFNLSSSLERQFHDDSPCPLLCSQTQNLHVKGILMNFGGGNNEKLLLGGLQQLTSPSTVQILIILSLIEAVFLEQCSRDGILGDPHSLSPAGKAMGSIKPLPFEQRLGTLWYSQVCYNKSHQ